MSYQVTLSPKADQEFIEVFFYYEELREGLGLDFEKELRKDSYLLRDNPLIYQLKYHSKRIAPLERFPYSLHYEVDIEQKTVTITALFHQKENPNKWTNGD